MGAPKERSTRRRRKSSWNAWRSNWQSLKSKKPTRMKIKQSRSAHQNSTIWIRVFLWLGKWNVDWPTSTVFLLLLFFLLRCVNTFFFSSFFFSSPSGAKNMKFRSKRSSTKLNATSSAGQLKWSTKTMNSKKGEVLLGLFSEPLRFLVSIFLKQSY